MKKLLIVGLFTIFYQLTSAQEVLTPLYRNTLIEEYLKANSLTARSINSTDTISLPFFDDFSSSTIYPDPANWLDQYVFINNTFAFEPISLGVATFDGFDENGVPYSNNSGSFGSADVLTSKPIDLNFPASDSIYLSFYYQPQGLGREPAKKDSLILEFKSPNDLYWTQVIRIAGSKTIPFKLVMVPITDPAFLKKGFQFRFRNKGSLYGGDDHWHIDYVRLERFRSRTDTNTFDVSFNSNPTSLLKSYTAVPYNQYDTTLLANNHFVSIKNNFTDPITNVLFTFTAYETNTHTRLDSATRGIPFAPRSTQSEASRKFAFEEKPYKRTVQTKYFLSSANDVFKVNDTIARDQIFDDYYAYDDGSAENGYGITTSTDGRVAYEFRTLHPDTLREVRIFFTRNSVDVSNNLFTLTIWKSIVPEEIIYQKTSLSPTYPTMINGFANYMLDSGIVLDETFYVGWVQNANFFMNVGFDANTNNGSKMFYKVTAEGWKQSIMQGSLMIRPVFSDEILSTGIRSNKNSTIQFKLYPNPAQDQLFIDIKDHSILNYQVEVIDLLGRNLITLPQSPTTINLDNLSKGIYLLKLTDLRSGKSSSKRFEHY